MSHGETVEGGQQSLVLGGGSKRRARSRLGSHEDEKQAKESRYRQTGEEMHSKETSDRSPDTEKFWPICGLELLQS